MMIINNKCTNGFYNVNYLTNKIFINLLKHFLEDLTIIDRVIY